MKHPPRFTVQAGTSACEAGGTFRVTGSELHHMRDVMRLRLGRRVILCIPEGRQVAGRIASFEPDAAIVTADEAPRQDESVRPRLILAAGVIKPARMDLLVEKAAELGAAEFWPLICARSVVREPSSERRDRWRRISLAAAKQSLRSKAMEVQVPVDVAAMTSSVPRPAVAVACVPGAQPLIGVLRRGSDSLKTYAAAVIAVGPEGDFTAAELALMREGGFVLAGLGNNRLRSETAALAALSIVTAVLAEAENRQGLEPRKME
jgi:16S rRNA (uracil1498-N3)-methyltransferase